MTKRPVLRVIDGGTSEEQRTLYRLRRVRVQEAPAEEAWPKDGEWRRLIRRLMKNPVKS